MSAVRIRLFFVDRCGSGINVVRERIKTYTRLNISHNRINQETGRVMPNFKIIILDEADMITPDAQAALRRVIENFSNISRFILICNYLHKIIGPIYSRCSAFHFKPIVQEAQVERLRFICQSEQLECDDDALDFLTRVSQGDMRRSVTLLQSTASLYSKVTEDAVRNVSGYPPRHIVEDIFTACMSPNNEVEAICKQVVHDGWEVAAIFQQLAEYVVNCETLSDVQKAMITIELSGRDFALLQGRFDSDPSVKEVELGHKETIAAVKERLFSEDISNHHKIRIIHAGRPLCDSAVLSGLRGYEAGEPLVLTVFVTKPDTIEPVADSVYSPEARPVEMEHVRMDYGRGDAMVLQI
ncbi:replication factor C subunit [Babesia ovata]|uniref:Replication factor C subunit n=1 Tax=Babesia ovata TaxID=189622 RepID=A0A2H6K8N3_9APIC|nr:replication factor C subunit [Babesia ovata]GBE59354.1 replication factor C subunit [Babesia ovata]